jgi:hypothetical protein
MTTNVGFNWGSNGSQPVTFDKYEAYIFNKKYFKHGAKDFD